MGDRRQQVTPRTVVLITASPGQRQRLSDLAEASHVHIDDCCTIDDLAAAVSRCAAVAVITEAYDERGFPVAPALRRLRRLAPSVAIILLLEPRRSSTVALAALRIADDVIFDGEISERLLWSAINHAAVRSADQSARNAVVGSMRVARRAGT